MRAKIEDNDLVHVSILTEDSMIVNGKGDGHLFSVIKKVFGNSRVYDTIKENFNLITSVLKKLADSPAMLELEEVLMGA